VSFNIVVHTVVHTVVHALSVRWLPTEIWKLYDLDQIIFNIVTKQELCDLW
jgi:hypothetical protein